MQKNCYSLIQIRFYTLFVLPATPVILHPLKPLNGELQTQAPAVKSVEVLTPVLLKNLL